MFASWIQGASVLRNMCAHNGFYQILLVMKYLHLFDEEWMIFVDNFDKLIQNNIGVISLIAMNLPTDWKEYLSV